MAAKKGKQKNSVTTNGEAAPKKTSNISGDVKRSIAAIFLFVLALISVLGFAGNAGIIGQYLDKIFGMIFGWGKWVSPLVVCGAGVVLLFRKSLSFYLTKIIGMCLSFLSLLGFFHLFQDAEKMLPLAKSGEGGGYLGYLIAAMLMKLSGTLAAAIILTALFLIGIFVAFNFSIIGLIRKLAKNKEGTEPMLEKNELKAEDYLPDPDEEKKDSGEGE
jgi:S-DNA-T family DNA segregation ATPase FtsK/SpoIIIE